MRTSTRTSALPAYSPIPPDSNDLCRCGRWAGRVHCPHCGSLQSTAYLTKESINRGNGRVDHVTAYRCRICGLIYNDDAWTKHCEAPDVGKGRGPGKVRKPRVNFKSLEDAPPMMAERVAEIQKLKDEGKW